MVLSSSSTQPADAERIILLTGSLTYRAQAFMEAAARLGLPVVRGLDLPRPLAVQLQPTLPLDFKDPDRAVDDLVAYVRRHPVRAILSVDDSATLIAARACAVLGLAHNDPAAALAARDKAVMRACLAAAGLPVPRFRHLTTDDDPTLVADALPYPVVVKPTTLSGSQGVIRADTPREFIAAFHRSAAIARATCGKEAVGTPLPLLVEDYLPGDEVVVEGILSRGILTVLALLDKPDPLIGPFFEETIYVTPSRLPPATQDELFACTARACAALGLREGPIHAELRLNERGPWIVEVAGRSIGGLCGQVLRFGTAERSLEEVILCGAMGRDLPPLERTGGASGVMMIPIPRGGVLRAVEGVEAAQAVPGIVGVEITTALFRTVVPLPEGSSYLGFLFARGDDPAAVEAALRTAHALLRFTIVPELRLRRIETSGPTIGRSAATS